MKLKLNPKVAPKIKLKRRLMYAAAGVIALATIAGIIVFFYSNIGITRTAHAATPSISGVINSYLRVTSVNLGTKKFVTDNLSGSIGDFAVGNKIIIYQATGATITTTNNASYGTITAYNNAGNYEFAKITSITGSDPYTIKVSSLVNSYTDTDDIQLVSVPQYTDVNVTGTITPVAWSSSQGRGGIIAFEASGILTLGANIDASNAGFAGGQIEGSNGPCPDNTTYVSNSNNFAQKGGGIADFTSGKQYARGPQANGGGGGNPHNAGGGGGSNYTAAGGGGQGYALGGCTIVSAGGLAGNAITYTSSTSKLFFGGGGGSGQQNDGLASPGGAGGGIIIVRAGTVKSTCAGTYGFKANGQSAVNSGGNDGAGAGGGGGVIMLDVSQYVLTCNILGQANGGNGGTVNNSESHGGGGGGGIGVIYEVNPATNARKLYTSTPGTNGQDCNTCTTPSGTAPATPSTTKIAISGPLPGQLAVLPIELLSFTAREENSAVKLEWVTSSEHNNDYFTVEHSPDGISFSSVTEVKGAGDSKKTLQYSSADNDIIAKTIYYRLKQTDYDGKFTYSKIIYVDVSSFKASVYIYPNPASDKLYISNSGESQLAITIQNERGSTVFRDETNTSLLEIPVSDWDGGIYIVDINNNGKRDAQRLLIRH